MASFECLCLTPADLQHPGIAIAASRAGGIGIIDVAFSKDWEQVQRNLLQLLAKTQGKIGLRFHVEQFIDVEPLIAMCKNRDLTIVLSISYRTTVKPVLDNLQQMSCRVLLEITSKQQLIEHRHHAIQGYVVKGHESGGWVGEDSAFILAQKINDSTLPFYVQGGIGVHNSAACRVIGAAGVVLDDQLLLMPESPLKENWRVYLRNINGQEAIGLGENFQSTCRVLSRPEFKSVKILKKLADDAELAHAANDRERAAKEWYDAATPMLRWDEPEQYAWPVGQASGLAEVFVQRYKTTGRCIQLLIKNSQWHINLASHQQILSKNSPLAKSHGTLYPMVQGPMTRVSDRAEFAQKVAESGALPLIALALMRKDPVEKLLQHTKELLGSKPWGVGILGFVSAKLREQQMEAIATIKPPYALIAGGRPDQAAKFEHIGIKTYIHAPVPRLLKLFIEQGAKRFIFEGRECGGHVGPLSSFVQWENMIDVLLENVKPTKASGYHVLFAGGIHDAQSAAMVSVMTAPLADMGINVGILMGTAYLFTEEIVSSGAILDEFQKQAIACKQTVNLESGPGHASRCAITPFAYEFFDTRRKMMREGKAHEEIKDVLEDLNLGRLRIASKGTKRDNEQGGKVVMVQNRQQVDEGMYMIGQVATMHDKAIKMADLHEQIATLQETIIAAKSTSEKAVLACGTVNQPSDIAIIGIGVLMPKAQAITQFWQNILDKVDVITEVPKYRWDWRLYYDPDRHARDKVYSKWGGFLDDVDFDPMYYGIPPKSLKSIEPMQLLALEVVRRGLEDAGLEDGDFDRENTAVIFGAGGGLGDLGLQYGMRTEIPRYVESPSKEIWDRLPEWTEESFAGCLLNVVSGRVANRFDFGGMNCTVDAACGSSLAAIHIAVNELESGRANVALAGGVDAVQSPFGFTCFSKTQALSPRGHSHSFDKDGDGIAISEGLAVIVLKRLSDAERDGDRIYSVIKATGSSSDGKALGLTAPLPAGQKRALSRVYAKAGYSPNTLALVEAHGTGTAAGDRAETETVVSSLKEHHANKKSCVLGSVKTMLGHTKASAGVAGLVKVAMALHHKVLPPHIHVTTPIDPISDAQSPVYLLNKARPWFRHPNHPRRAGVSAFGFGGTNFHASLEEYEQEYRVSAKPNGAEAWPVELLIFKAVDKQSMKIEINKILSALQAGAKPRLSDLAYTLALHAEKMAVLPATAALVVDSIKALEVALVTLDEFVVGTITKLPPSIKYYEKSENELVKIAFLFPGQGAQYVDMCSEPVLYLDKIRHVLEQADAVLADCYPEYLTQIIYPPSAYSEEETKRYQVNITNTHYAQPAIGALSIGYVEFFAHLGIQPEMIAGHSYGEYSALHAAGVISKDDFFKLSELRGRVMSKACELEPVGSMAAVKMQRSELEAKIARYGGVSIANHNSPQQTVLTGPKLILQEVINDFKKEKINCQMLPVAGAFHSALMKPAQAELNDGINAADINAPQVTLYGNTKANKYPEQEAEIRDMISNHMLNSVEFVAQISNMHTAGANVFIELGPKRILTGLTGQILKGKSHLAVAVDDGHGEMKALLSCLATLSVHGVRYQPSLLFTGRNVQKLDLGRLTQTCQPKARAKTAWLLNGGSIRQQSEKTGKTGSIAAITADNKAEVEAAYLKTLADKMPKPAALAQPSVPQIPAPAMQNNMIPQAWHSYQQTMQQFLTLQEQVMQQFIAGSDSSGGMPMPMPNMPQPTAQVAPLPVPLVVPAATKVVAEPVLVESAPIIPMPQTVSFDTQSLTQLLLDLVSERTGYPQDMLGIEQDMEAELGIDSIKRVEILGALQKALPSKMSTHIQDNMEMFTKAKSLQALVLELAPLLEAQSVSQSVAEPAHIDLKTILLKLVSDRTGYPEDMLGLEQDMEAELGIDSIKRVEILGALQKALPQALSAHIQDNMEMFTKVKSLQTIISELEKITPSAQSVASSEVVTPTLSSTQLLSTLVQLVSDRTGYPEDMLGLEQDMEAELGIDSIKRVEILGALQKALPEQLAAYIQDNMETFTKAKSLNAIISALAKHVPETSEHADSSDHVVETSIDVQPLLIKLVSDRTGYPEEMLGLEQDMEAELGIDSIKRVEILGALQKELPTIEARFIQDNMEKFTKVKSLSGILQELATISPQAPAKTVKVTEKSDLDEVQLQALLIALVSERTGYPEDMLGLEQDMEAELGIDSIKRVEILGALQKALPGTLASYVQDNMENFTKVKSLAGLLEQLAKHKIAMPSRAVAETAATATIPIKQHQSSPAKVSPRYVMQAYPSSLPDITLQPLTGHYLVTQDNQKVAQFFCESVEKRGAKTTLLSETDFNDLEQLQHTLDKCRKQEGAITAIVHLAPLESVSFPDNLAQWRSKTAYHGKALFQLLQMCAEELQNGVVVSVSELDGSFARKNGGGHGLATGGIHTGLLKSLQQEWTGCKSKALDFAPGLSPESIADIVLHEMVAGDSEIEVGYDEQNRILFRTQEALLEKETEQLTLHKERVVLVTGGARGITAALAKDLAQTGLTLILVGRSVLPAEEEDNTKGIDDLTALRKCFMTQAKANNLTPTPVLIEKNIKQLFRDREILKNMDDFKKTGAKVEYQIADVSNEAVMCNLLKDIYARYQRIDIVLHGAGVIEDKLIVDKSSASFDRVYDTKVDSAFILARYLEPQSLKCLVFFTSVAGRYGNRGQSDYASANETVNRMAWQLDHQWPGRVLAINWGPWDTTGMASDEVKRQFAEKGVEAIPLDSGRAYFSEEIRYGKKGQAEVIAGLGPWANESMHSSAVPAATPKGSMPGLVLIPHEPVAQPNGTVTLEHSFSLTSDPYLDDHRLNRNPVVPATGALAWMAEFVQAAWPEWVVTEVRDVNIFKGLILDNKHPRKVILKARGSSHADAESLQVAVEITNPNQGIAYYRASVILAPQIAEAPMADIMPLISGADLDVHKMYHDYLFHGQRFHRISAVNRLNEQGMDVIVTPSDPLQWTNPTKPEAHWLFDPGMLDTGPQLAMVWSRLQQNISALPARFVSVKRYGAEPLSGELNLYFRSKASDNPQGIAYEATYVDSEGRVRVQMDAESTGSVEINRLADSTDEFGHPRTK